jgi:Transposase DDE domain
MSDSRRVYRAINQAVKQLYLSEPRGNVARHLNTLAGMVTGLVLGKSCHLPKLAHKAPDATLAESRHKRFSRWVQNDAITAEIYYLPFVQALLISLTRLRPLTLVMDGSEVAHSCLALVVSVLYGQRALPVAWVVVAGRKGHFPAATHVRLLQQMADLVPAGTEATFLGDGEFDSVELQQAVAARGWVYVCRTAQNTQVQVDGAWYALADIAVQRGYKKMWRQVRFTAAGYGPVQVIGWWGARYDEPLYWVTNWADRDEACRRYQKRAQIETLFSDQKSRGFQLDRSLLDHPERVQRLLLAACLAYLWLIYLGTLASQPHWRRLVHRADRCDLSRFQLGLRLLDFWLEDDAPLRVAFLPQATQAQTLVFKSVR